MSACGYIYPATLTGGAQALAADLWGGGLDNGGWVAPPNLENWGKYEAVSEQPYSWHAESKKPPRDAGLLHAWTRPVHCVWMRGGMQFPCTGLVGCWAYIARYIYLSVDI